MDIKPQSDPLLGAVVRLAPPVSVSAAGSSVDEVVSIVEPAAEKLSSLAKDLSEAAQRAAVRDGAMSRNELAKLAAAIKERIIGESYDFSREVYDAEVPDSDDLERLERARQATDYLHAKAPNPFAGMSQEQLSLIVYDEGGAFTVNERRAAWLESNRQSCEWTSVVGEKLWNVRQRPGETAEVLKEILEYYRSLPPIMEAQYGNYETSISSRIGSEELEGIEWPGFKISLVDMIANEWTSIEDLLAQDADATDRDPKGTA